MDIKRGGASNHEGCCHRRPTTACSLALTGTGQGGYRGYQEKNTNKNKHYIAFPIEQFNARKKVGYLNKWMLAEKKKNMLVS